MKNIIIIISLIFCNTIIGISQTINFAYDAAGNRVSRTISLGSTKSAFGGGGTAELREDKNFFTETLAQKQIKIYPNPTRGQLRVEILGYEDLETNSSIQVFTTGGALLYKTSTLSQTNTINLTDKPAGLYLMVIIIADEHSTWKIIKK